MGLLAVDLGTSSLKAGLYEGGALIATAHEPLVTSHPGPGLAEQDPEAWWAAMVRTVRTVTSGAGSPSVEAIAITGQSDSLVAVDAEGAPVRPCMLWMDPRGLRELEGALSTLGADSVRHVTGLRPGPNFTAPKAAWLRVHEPSSFTRARWLLQPKDYLLLRVIGEAVTDPSSASRYLAFDRHTLRWWPDMLEALGIPPGILPPIVPSDGVAGRTTPSAAVELGLRHGVPVATGAADRAAEALGLGIDATEVMVSTGTATGVVRPIAHGHEIDDRSIITPFHAIRGETLAILSQPTSGVVLQWLAGLIGDRDVASDEAVDRLAREAEASPPGAHGLIVLPHFMGARSIRWQPDARGAMNGLTLGTTRGDLARAIVEGVACEVGACLDHLAAAAGSPARLVLTGGANRSSLWAQTLVDVAGIGAVRYRDRDGALAGAMVLAGAAAGSWSDLRSAARLRLRPDALFSPDPDRAAIYGDLRRRYEEFSAQVLQNP
jgi:xylulokinase